MRTSSLPELQLPEKHSRFIHKYIKKVAHESYVDKVILFGSCVNGKADIDSDIDIFVVTKTNLADNSDELYNLLYKSTESIPLSEYVCCDIITASTDDFKNKITPLIRTIIREGVELNGLL
jgi:predicted nucleotidyltransferase